MKSVATQENPIFDLDEARSDINVESSDTPCEIDDDRSGISKTTNVKV